MSLPKVLNEIKRDLEAIKAKLGIEAALGIDGDGEIAPVPKLTIPPPVEPEPETPEQVAARLDYDTYSAAEVIERVDSLTEDERAALRAYEAANKNRPTVLRALGNS